jgi:1,4-alpha-glucan branching enzyme
MPGDDWQKAANLRLLYAHQYGHPGKKLLFMGSEVGQYGEWNHDGQVEWDLLKDHLHAGIADWVRELNRLYRSHPAMWNDQPGGFEWIDFQDAASSIASYIRSDGDSNVVFLFNFTPVPRTGYRIGLPGGDRWRVVLNSDATRFGGSGYGADGEIATEDLVWHNRPVSATMDVPPLGVIILENVAED